jgi:VWFA-related protein
MLMAAGSCLLPALPPETRHLVTLDVAAVDAAGGPIADLRANDLQVLDNGQPRTIALFRHKGPRPLADPLAPNEYSNRPSVKPPHTLVILLDLLNEPLLTAALFRNELVDVVAHLDSEDPYLYVLTNHGELYPIHGLGDSATSWTREAPARLNKVINRNRGFRFGYADYGVRSMITWPRLTALASGFAPLPGRKTLLWITRGMPTPMDVKQDEARRLTLAMRDAGVVIYPVDPLVSGTDLLDEAERHDALRIVAGMTGGRASFAEGIKTALAQAFADDRGSYEVGFYSPDESWDGKYHKIRLTTGRARSKILTESGYFAAPPPSGLEDAIAGRMDTSEIGLRVIMSPGSNPGLVRLNLRIDAEDLPFPTSLTLTVAGFDVEPFELASASVPRPAQISGPINVKLNLTRRDYAAALKNGVELTKDILINDRIRTLWLVVSDPASNRYGAVLVPWASARRD